MTTLTATPDPATGSVALDITKTTQVDRIVRTNANGSADVRVTAGQLPSTYVATPGRVQRITNPAFGAGAAGWYSRWDGPGAATSTTTTSATGGAAGGGYIRKTWSTSGVAAQDNGFSVLNTTCTPGQWVTISGYMRTSQEAVVVRAVIAFDDAVGALLEAGSAETLLVPGQWSRISFTLQAPAGTTRVHGTWSNYNTSVSWAPGATFDLSSPLIEFTDELRPFFYGGSPADAYGSYAWTGAANASTSQHTTGGTLVLTDFEPAHGTNTYNVYAPDGSFVTGSTVLELDRPWLTVPVMPQYSEQVDLVTAWNGSRESASTVHRPLGRPDSLVAIGKLGDRAGELELFCPSYADARRLERVFERGEVVQLRQRVEGLDMYFTALSLPVAPHAVEGEDGTVWALKVNYVEVRRPAGALAGALGWNFDALALDYASFDAVAAAYTDFDALTLGDSIV